MNHPPERQSKRTLEQIEQLSMISYVLPYTSLYVTSDMYNFR